MVIGWRDWVEDPACRDLYIIPPINILFIATFVNTKQECRKQFWVDQVARASTIFNFISIV